MPLALRSSVTKRWTQDTCIIILVCAVHTKARQVLMSPRKCSLIGRTQKQSFTLSRLGLEPMVAVFIESPAQHANHLATAPVTLFLAAMPPSLISHRFYMVWWRTLAGRFWRSTWRSWIMHGLIWPCSWSCFWIVYPGIKICVQTCWILVKAWPLLFINKNKCVAIKGLYRLPSVTGVPGNEIKKFKNTL